MVQKMDEIRVAVIGASGSGKSSLTACLHNLVFQRPDDRRLFQFIVMECGDSPRDLWKEFQFGLVTFPLDQPKLQDPARTLAWETAKLSPRRQLLCVVGTKLDLFPDYSNEDLTNRNQASKFAYYHHLQYYGTSSVTGAGISEVCRFITNQIHPVPSPTLLKRLSVGLRSTVDAIGSWGLDIVASAFSLPVPSNVNESTADELELDESTLSSLLTTQEAQAWDLDLSKHSTFWLGAQCVPAHKITSKLLAKNWPEEARSERENMIFVRAHTTIPVPQPRYPHLSSHLVMDLIDGSMLLECWESQSFFMKFRIACTLRGYMSQLRQLSGATIPGAIVDGIVSGPLFEDEDRGPFPSSEQFRLWCEMVAHTGWTSVVRSNRWAQEQDPDRRLVIPPPPIMGVEWPLVFTHGDLNLGNIMLSKDGVLWLIDWATSGFFPPWLDSVGMKLLNDRAPSSWKRFHWFIAGSYPRYEQFWDFFLQDVHRFTRPSR